MIFLFYLVAIGVILFVAVTISNNRTRTRMQGHAGSTPVAPPTAIALTTSCMTCGASWPNDTPFCGSCGTKFSASPSSSYLLTIGDIGVTTDSIVTPNGTAPLAGSVWIVQDASQTQRKTPPWAIVLAIIGALLCLVGLLFLLVKKEVVVGYATVTVTNGQFQHLTQIPVSSTHDMNRVRQDVAQAQQLAARKSA